MPKDFRLREKHQRIERRARAEKASGRRPSLPYAEDLHEIHSNPTSFFGSTRDQQTLRSSPVRIHPALPEQLKRLDLDHRKFAKRLIEAGKEALRQLENQLESADATIQYNAVKTLYELDSISALALQRVQLLSRSTHLGIRCASENVLIAFSRSGWRGWPRIVSRAHQRLDRRDPRVTPSERAK